MLYLHVFDAGLNKHGTLLRLLLSRKLISSHSFPDHPGRVVLLSGPLSRYGQGLVRGNTTKSLRRFVALHFLLFKNLEQRRGSDIWPKANAISCLKRENRFHSARAGQKRGGRSRLECRYYAR